MIQLIQAAWRNRQKLVEKHLVGAIEQLEGRVPTNEEVARYGRTESRRDGSETYFWKDRPVLIVSATKFVGEGDTKVVGWEFQTLFRDETQNED